MYLCMWNFALNSNEKRAEALVKHDCGNITKNFDTPQKMDISITKSTPIRRELVRGTQNIPKNLHTE